MYFQFESCKTWKDFLFTVDIFIDGNNIGVPSKNFIYDPVNVRNVIKYLGCLNSNGTLGGEMEMKKKNKYFEVCLKKMQIFNKNHSNDTIIIITVLFYQTKTEDLYETVTSIF